MICVLAGTRQQYEWWLDRHDHTSATAVHAFEPEIVLAGEFTSVVVIGTFWNRDDAAELYGLALSRVRKTAAERPIVVPEGAP